jgi:hypothetical protein
MGDSRPSATRPTGAELQVSAQGRTLLKDDAVILRRLLAVVTLTPAQAAMLARDLVDELALLASHGQLPDRVDNRTVLVTGHGHLRVMAGEAEARRSQPAAEAAEHATPPAPAAVDLIRQLDNNARRVGPSIRSLANIDDSPADLTDLAARVHDAAGQLVGDQDRRVRQEIAVVVAAITGGQRGMSPVGPAEPVAVPMTTSWRRSSRHAWHRRRRSPWRSMLVMLLVLAVAGAVWWGAPRAWPELQRGWDSLFTLEPPPRELPPLPDAVPADLEDMDVPVAGQDVEQRPAPVELPAPESAGPVTAVSVERVEGPCRPGEQCVVRVEVALERAGTARRIDWELSIVDRCTDEVDTRPGVTVIAQPGWTQVWGNSAFELPAGTALAVIAVTGSPATAASSPLLVPPDGSC